MTISMLNVMYSWNPKHQQLHIPYLRSSSAADKPAMPAPMIIVSASKNVWDVSGVAKTQILYACQFNEQYIYL